MAPIERQGLGLATVQRKSNRMSRNKCYNRRASMQDIKDARSLRKRQYPQHESLAALL